MRGEDVGRGNGSIHNLTRLYIRRYNPLKPEFGSMMCDPRMLLNLTKKHGDFYGIIAFIATMAHLYRDGLPFLDSDNNIHVKKTSDSSAITQAVSHLAKHLILAPVHLLTATSDGDDSNVCEDICAGIASAGVKAAAEAIHEGDPFFKDE